MKFYPNINNWVQVGFFTNFEPNLKLTCPILLTSPIIAVSINAPIFTDDNKFRLGAFVQREIFTGLTIGGSSDARLNSAQKLYVNRLQLLTYSVIVPNYSLIISPLLSGANVSVSAWEYTGLIE